MMSRILTLLLLLLTAVFADLALADPEACKACHDAGEFAGADAEWVKEALEDAGLPAHGPFADLSIEEVKALLAALSE